MGDEIRHEIVKKQSAENKWKMIGSLVQDGNMAPEVSNYTVTYYYIEIVP